MASETTLAPMQQDQQPAGATGQPQETPKPAGATPKVGVTQDELLFYMQQCMEQVKFEVKQEIVDAINAKAQQLSDVDPTTSTSLRAVAAAVNSAVSDPQPLGENEQFNQQNAGQQQAVPQKQASDVAWDAMIEKLEGAGYFEKNASYDEKVVEQDLKDLAVVIGRGMEKYAEDNSIDFNDSNYHEMLKELILDNTLYNIGLEND